jgi:endoglucanase
MIVYDCLNAKIVPIITFSASDFRENPDAQTLQRNVNFWKDVATEFKNYPYVLSYDLIIESSRNISQHDDMLNEFYKSDITDIRKIDKFRILFITPNGMYKAQL